MEIINRRYPHRFRLVFTGILLLGGTLLRTSVLFGETKAVVLAIRQNEKEFNEAFLSLKNELSLDFEVKELITGKKTTPEDIRIAMQTVKPRLTVLMDNADIALYRKYQSNLQKTDSVVPSISIMGIMIKDAISGLKNACGISYEIPVVTSVINLRSVIPTPIEKVGIVHREYLSGFIKQNAVFCQREGVDLVTIALPNKSGFYKKMVRSALHQLGKRNIQALWIPNDNKLLHPEIIRSVWIPVAKKMRIPVIVGIEILVNPKLDFGTFAVLPDHAALGKQTAEMVYEIRDNNWQCRHNQVDPPLAIYKIINLRQAARHFKVTEDRLGSVDKKLK